MHHHRSVDSRALVCADGNRRDDSKVVGIISGKQGSELTWLTIANEATLGSLSLWLVSSITLSGDSEVLLSPTSAFAKETASEELALVHSCVSLVQCQLILHPPAKYNWHSTGGPFRTRGTDEKPPGELLHPGTGIGTARYP